MSEEKDDFIPNWEAIYNLTEEIDKCVEEAITKEKLSFLEVDIAFLMLKEKLTQEKQIALIKMRDNGEIRTTSEIEEEQKKTHIYG